MASSLFKDDDASISSMLWNEYAQRLEALWSDAARAGKAEYVCTTAGYKRQDRALPLPGREKAAREQEDENEDGKRTAEKRTGPGRDRQIQRGGFFDLQRKC